MTSYHHHCALGVSSDLYASPPSLAILLHLSSSPLNLQQLALLPCLLSLMTLKQRQESNPLMLPSALLIPAGFAKTIAAGLSPRLKGRRSSRSARATLPACGFHLVRIWHAEPTAPASQVIAVKYESGGVLRTSIMLSKPQRRKLSLKELAATEYPSGRRSLQAGVAPQWLRERGLEESRLAPSPLVAPPWSRSQ